MEINVSSVNGIEVVALTGKFDAMCAGQVAEKISGLIAAGETSLVLDLSGVDYVSSAAIRVILKATRDAKERGGRMCLCSLQPFVRDVFETVGLASALPIFSTRQDALASQ